MNSKDKKIYYIYHIPGKKIGATSNLNTRVTLMQGYKEGEYEVLEQSTDIDYISDREIELQKSYGYKIDRQKYNNLIKSNNKMNINVTEQTTTFPCPLNKLKGNLMDSIGDTWKTEHGLHTLDSELVKWILKNAKTSMYNDERCYVYNKALSEYNKVPSVFDNIRLWAQERGIYDKGDSKTQYVKLMEEAGELAQSLLKRDEPEIRDAIGDMVVVLTNLAHLEGVTIEKCINDAYDVIAARKGEMVNGTFVKQTL
jgi:NTP pyrophosphatase (non-canonical NTP hydrolase)